MSQQLATFFVENGLRLTKARRAVCAALEEAQKPLLIVELIARCPDIDKVSVYRTVTVLHRMGVLTVVTRGWKQLYELAAPYAPHHHHMICEVCGNDTEIQSVEIERVIRSLEKQHGFVSTGHHFELTGCCHRCKIAT